MFTFLDLFAGIGGFHIAAKNNGGQCVGFSEVAKDAIEYYCINHKMSKDKNLGDITKIVDPPSVDFITAGVPCQSWSVAGKRLGFDDDRGQLWNDTIYLLTKSQPKAFLFENVKGLTDKHNIEAFHYILSRIEEAGYHAAWKILNSFDYGSPQMRERVYIVGFRDPAMLEKFKFPEPTPNKLTMHEILTGEYVDMSKVKSASRSLSKNATGENDYYVFNDARDGATTIHSWEITNTSDNQRRICEVIMRNRRKSKYGPQDGNPMSFDHIGDLLPDINKADLFRSLTALVRMNILRLVGYRYEYTCKNVAYGREEQIDGRIVKLCCEGKSVPEMYTDPVLKKFSRIKITSTISSLVANNMLRLSEQRYDLRNSKVSTGINGVYRVFLRSCNIFPTMVASDTNDYVAMVDLPHNSKAEFLKHIALDKNYRKITNKEACRIQGFPEDFELPPTRQRWMKLIGNSVTVPVIDKITKAIVATGVFDGNNA